MCDEGFSEWKLNGNYSYLSVPDANLFPQVSLVPPGLACKRVWNKKYPICIILAEGELAVESLLDGQEEGETVEKPTIPSHLSPATLYLFGRTGREKEEWFQHLLSASKAAAQSESNAEENTGNKNEFTWWANHLLIKMNDELRVFFFSNNYYLVSITQRHQVEERLLMKAQRKSPTCRVKQERFWITASTWCSWLAQIETVPPPAPTPVTKEAPRLPKRFNTFVLSFSSNTHSANPDVLYWWSDLAQKFGIKVYPLDKNVFFQKHRCLLRFEQKK